MKPFQLIVRPVVSGEGKELTADSSLLFIQSEPGKNFSQTVKKYSDMTPDEQTAYRNLVAVADPDFDMLLFRQPAKEETEADMPANDPDETGEPSGEEFSNDESFLND